MDPNGVEVLPVIILKIGIMSGMVGGILDHRAVHHADQVKRSESIQNTVCE